MRDRWLKKTPRSAKKIAICGKNGNTPNWSNWVRLMLEIEMALFRWSKKRLLIRQTKFIWQDKWKWTEINSVLICEDGKDHPAVELWEIKNTLDDLFPVQVFRTQRFRFALSDRSAVEKRDKQATKHRIRKIKIVLTTRKKVTLNKMLKNRNLIDNILDFCF